MGNAGPRVAIIRLSLSGFWKLHFFSAIFSLPRNLEPLQSLELLLQPQINSSLFLFLKYRDGGTIGARISAVKLRFLFLP